MFWKYWDPSIIKFKKKNFLLFNQSNRLELAIPSSKINPLYRIFNTHVSENILKYHNNILNGIIKWPNIY
ncbi:hypothetical protein BpHYR1_039021 [Brachionus plicatilis]|uniref:Uncharacterized protein n=1 Tax=Brachionus plicatilis TaxID=10195 RepID=A0A3M7RMD1_BRAPC|nr:hypothetical protein BpHYR1_039021 [Brachionus plicatilis]